MPDRNDSTPEHEIDARTLTATELQKKYEPTYSSWRNMKQRGNDVGAIISPAFAAFPNFLIAVGPRPDKDHTIDRIDHSNPEYGPGLVRWSDKRGQANNRSTTILLTVDGETKPLPIWAEETGQKADTLRARRDKGWSDDEIVKGRKKSAPDYSDPWNYRPWLSKDVDHNKWEYLYQTQGEDGQRPTDFYIHRLRMWIKPLTEYIELNIQYTEVGDTRRSLLDEKCLECNRKLEPLERRLDEALIEKCLIDMALLRTPKPRGWRGPNRFNHTPD